MLPDINLLPKYEKERSFLYILFIAGIIIAALLTAFMIYQYISVNGELKKVSSQNNELITKKEDLELQVAQLESFGKESLEDAVIYAEKYVTPTSKLINQLMTFLPATGYMSTYKYIGDEVAIESHFETMTDASAYASKLAASEYISDVKVNRIEAFDLEAPQIDSEEGTETINEDPFNIIPRYRVTYSFQVNQVALKKETNENE